MNKIFLLLSLILFQPNITHAMDVKITELIKPRDVIDKPSPPKIVNGCIVCFIDEIDNRSTRIDPLPIPSEKQKNKK